MRGKQHVPTEASRLRVRDMTRRGATQPVVAAALGIEEKCLRRHYRDELDVGLAEANTAVAGNLFRIATGDGPGAVTAAIFWLKTRGGWREADRAAAPTEGQTITLRWADEGEAA